MKVTKNNINLELTTKLRRTSRILPAAEKKTATAAKDGEGSKKGELKGNFKMVKKKKIPLPTVPKKRKKTPEERMKDEKRCTEEYKALIRKNRLN